MDLQLFSTSQEFSKKLSSIESLIKLKNLSISDSEVIAKLAGTPEVTSTTTSIPYPYTAEMAKNWIESTKTHEENKVAITRGITASRDGKELLIGCVSGTFVQASKAEMLDLGYWIGRPFWGNGYASVAAVKFLTLAYYEYGISSFTARHLVRNRSSGSLLQNIGFHLKEIRESEEVKPKCFESVAYYFLDLNQAVI